MEKNESSRPDLLGIFLPCQAALRVLCPAVCEGWLGGGQGEAWGRALATDTPESYGDTHGTRCLHGLVAFLDPSEKQNIWDHRASFPTLQIKPPGVTVRQGLQS